MVKNSLLINGAQGRNRTADTVIFSHVLYQLSYLGSYWAASGALAASRARSLTVALVAVHPCGVGWRARDS